MTSAPSTSIQGAASDAPYKYEAFLSHEGTEKNTVLSVLLGRLAEFKKLDSVFYDNHQRRGGTIDGKLVPQLTKALLSSKRLIVFLTPEFLASKWPFWELMTYWDMMEEEKTAHPSAPHKKIIWPIFYRISAKDCKALATADPTSASVQELLGKNKLRRDMNVGIHRMQQVLNDTAGILGVDARQEDRHLSDHEIVRLIIHEVFGVNIASPRPSLSQLDLVPPKYPPYLQTNLQDPGRPEHKIVNRLLSASPGQQPGSERVSICVHGLPGAGKTTMCNIVARDQRVQSHFGDRIFWIGLGQGSTVLLLLQRLLHTAIALGVQHAEDVEQALLSKITEVKKEQQGSRHEIIEVYEYVPIIKRMVVDAAGS